MSFMIRQEIPVSVSLTGKVSRWESTNPDVEGTIASVEVEVDAAGYEGKTLWINADKLMFPDWSSIEPDVLERACRKETDKHTVADILCTHYPGSGWSAEQLQHHYEYALVIADIFVEEAYRRDELPADLVGRVRQAGKLGNVMYGVSLYAVLKDLDDKGIKPWDETLAEVQCPPGIVDDFAEASIDAVMAGVEPNTSMVIGRILQTKKTRD